MGDNEGQPGGVYLLGDKSFVSRWPLIVGKLSDLGERFLIRGGRGRQPEL